MTSTLRTRKPLQRVKALAAKSSLARTAFRPKPGDPLKRKFMCQGKRYPDMESALASKAVRERGATATPCRACEGVHVTGGIRPRKDASLAPRKARRRESVPPALRSLVEARDALTCQRCASMRDLDVHHRRPKGMGGATGKHVDCACNCLLLCRVCHDDAHHGDPRSAMAEGFLLSKLAKDEDGELIHPGTASVMRFARAGGGASLYPHCDGQWSTAPQARDARAEGGEAA